MNFLRFLSIINILFILSCSDNKSDIVPVDSSKSFSVLGFCVVAPNNSMNAKYAIINKTIAEVNFDYMNNNYYYRASKNLDELLSFHKNISEYKKNFDDESNIEIIIQTNSNEYIATWNVNSINYLLFTDDKNNHIDDLSLELMRNKAIK